MRIGRCRSCGGTSLLPVLDLGSMPLANAFVEPEHVGIAEPRFPLELVFCETCALVQITETVPPEDLFSDYRYFSSYSATMVDHARELVERLILERGLGPASLALEVASNDGYLLQHYLAHGIPVLGIDPAQNVAAAARAKGIETIAAFFEPDLARSLRNEGRSADVIHANNVLAHVADINSFTAAFELALKPEGVAVIETPYVKHLVDGCLVDTIYHEHLFYYSLTSVESLFRRNGLEVIDVEEVPIHGGSLRLTAAREGATIPSSSVQERLEEEAAAGINDFAYYRRFADRVHALLDHLRHEFLAMKQRGLSLAGYGAAAKATVLLNALDLPVGTIDFIVDETPYKQGRYMPGVKIPIVPPARLRAEAPDCVVVFAWNFAEEIIAKEEAYLASGGRFVIPLPEMKLVDAVS